jgi:N-glycosylase/DNA lyase
MQLKLDVVFDLDFTLCCGQVFRWRKIEDWWFGTVGNQIFKIRQNEGTLEFENAKADFIRTYFALNDDLGTIGQSIKKDAFITAALHRFEGLRIARQNPWECLISFICATYKSIPSIEQMLLKLSKKYGEKEVFDGLEFYLFPSAKKLAHASENGLKECGLGYRTKYVSETAKTIADGRFDLDELKRLPYLEARKRLLDLPGVGLKVADCVLLFSLDKTEAFPVDVWVKRVMLNHYANQFPEELIKKLSKHESLSNSEYKQLNGFGREYFGKYAGYAQEYLYHYERTGA